MILTGQAKLAGVIGWPVGHSRSPRLHGWWLQHYGIDGAYVPLAVPPEQLAQVLRTLPHLRLGNPRTGPVRVRLEDLEAWMAARIVSPEEVRTGDTEVRPRGTVSTSLGRQVDRPAARRKGRAPLPDRDGPGGRAEAAGRGTPGTGPEDLTYARRGKAA